MGTFRNSAETLLICVAITGPASAQAHTPPVFRGTPVLTIGNDDSVDASYSFENISGLAFDSHGRIVVSDNRANNVRVFSPTGALELRFGRLGAGPGDLDRPCCLAVSSNGQLWVEDPGNHRYSIYRLGSASATYLRSILMTGTSNREAERVAWNSAGFLIESRSTSMLQGQPGIVRSTVDSSGNVLRVDSIPGPPSDSIPLARLIRDFGQGRVARTTVFQPFGPVELRALGPNGVFALAVSSRYAVALFDNNHRLLATIGRPVQAPAVSPSEAAEAEKRLVGAAGSMAASRSEIAFDVPRLKAPLQSLGYDLDGRLWVELATAQGAMHSADVYGRAGQWVATARWPANVTLSFLAIRGWSGLGVSTDSLGVQRVVKLQFAPVR